MPSRHWLGNVRGGGGVDGGQSGWQEQNSTETVTKVATWGGQLFGRTKASVGGYRKVVVVNIWQQGNTSLDPLERKKKYIFRY